MAKKQKKIQEVVEITPENKCDFCIGSKCCTYVTQNIDKPTTIADFDLLRWQIAHAGVEVFKDDGLWYLLINNACEQLLPNGRCGIYETRPFICREHSNDYCEYDAPAEDGWDVHFKTIEDLDKYCRKRFKRWDKRFEPKGKKKSNKKKTGKKKS